MFADEKIMVFLKDAISSLSPALATDVKGLDRMRSWLLQKLYYKLIKAKSSFSDTREKTS